MNDELRHLAIEKLKRGEDLPPEWQSVLFPNPKKECELIYQNKEREEDVMADTMAVPLQPVRSFGKNGFGWHNRLIFGDNLQVLKRLWEEKKAGKLCNADGTLGIKLIYIDPPFATKQEFKGTQDQKAYQDKISGSEFIEFLRKRLVLMKHLLSDDGALCIHLDQKKGHYAKVILDEIFGEGNFRNEIIVRRIQKNYVERDYIASLNIATDSIYVYSRSGETSFSPVYKKVSIEETWHSLDAPNWSGTRPNLVYSLFGRMPPRNRCWAWNKERAEAAIKKGDLRPNPRTGKPEYRIPAREKVICTSLWDDLVAYSFNSGYPTEKSESLLARIIEMGSKRGDLVLDAFAGSGTTLAVAEKLGRRWIGVDCGKLAIYTVQKRMLNLQCDIGNKGGALSPKTFMLYNAGLYDFSSLKELPWDEWRFFALELFGCKDEPHSIGGLKLDGKLKGASVLVFNQHENRGKRIDEETIQDIHAVVGKRIGTKFFLIAPRGVFDFQQDYFDLDGVRYYALRIPYSVINELHQRQFTALVQPSDERAVNDIVDAWGFDFIQPPTVGYDLGVRRNKDQPEAFLKLKNFQSRARLRGKDVRGGLESFSMLMLDLDYDGNVFKLDLCYFAHQLEESNWECRFPAKQVGKQVMVVFIDLHGNEAREVIPSSRFRSMSGKGNRRGRVPA